jgi:hypothetical protein
VPKQVSPLKEEGIYQVLDHVPKGDGFGIVGQIIPRLSGPPIRIQALAWSWEKKVLGSFAISR